MPDYSPTRCTELYPHYANALYGHLKDNVTYVPLLLCTLSCSLSKASALVFKQNTKLSAQKFSINFTPLLTYSVRICYYISYSVAHMSTTCYMTSFCSALVTAGSYCLMILSVDSTRRTARLIGYLFICIHAYMRAQQT
jgi:hypothetical protein